MNLSRLYDVLCKSIVVGDSRSGKTILCNRLHDPTAPAIVVSPTPTIGIDFKIRFFTVDGKLVKHQIWDTSGQERFRSITQTYYRGAHIIFCVHRAEDSVTRIMRDIKTHAMEDAIIYDIVTYEGSIPDNVVQGEQSEQDKRRYHVSLTTGEGAERLLVDATHATMTVLLLLIHVFGRQ